MDNGEKHQYIVPYEQEKKMKESEEKKAHHNEEEKDFFDREVVSIVSQDDLLSQSESKDW